MTRNTPSSTDEGVFLYLCEYPNLSVTLVVHQISMFYTNFKLKVYKKSSKSSNKWVLRRFFVYTLIKN